MSTNPRVITLMWSEKLSTRMFTDFFRKIYLGGVSPFIIQPSLYNSMDIVEAQYAAIKLSLKPCIVSFLEVPASFDGAQTPPSLIEASDLVLHFKPERNGQSVLTIPVKVPPEHQHIVDRWSANLVRMQHIV